MTKIRDSLGGRALGRVGRTRLLVFLSVLGPGLIAANANNDAGGITTWSIAGARYGYSLLWVLIVLTPMLAITQEMGARMGMVTGKGLSSLIRERFSLRMTAFAMLTLLVANLGTTAAEFSGVAGAAELFGVPRYVGVPVVAVVVWALVVRGSYRRVERVFLGLSTIYLTYIVSAVLSNPEWRLAARGAAGLEMDWTTGVVLFLIVTVGTTITPWGQFFIQAYVVDKRVPVNQYLYTKFEVFSASVFSDLISAFIVIACAATLHRQGIVIETAEDAARALRPLAGDLAWILFGIGLLNVSILAAAVLPLTTAYAICEAFGFESGLDWSFREAPTFYGIITAVLALPALLVLVPGMPLIGLILTAQSVNGILTPVILVFVLTIVNDRRVMGDYVNSRGYNVAAWAFTALVVALSVALVGVTLFG